MNDLYTAIIGILLLTTSHANAMSPLIEKAPLTEISIAREQLTEDDKKTSEVRMGIDLGSGIFKALIAKYNFKEQSLKILKTVQIDVTLGNDFMQSKDGMLSEESQEIALAAILQFVDEARAAGVTKSSGVVTAVFRKAKNGLELLEKLKAVSGFNLNKISQEVEARIGRKTAVALYSGMDEEKIISFDLGSGSFQFAGVTDGQECVYEGQYGVSTIAHLFVTETRGQIFSSTSYASLNPISTEEMSHFMANFQSKLSPCPVWLTEKLQNAGVVVAIGDISSIFSAGASAVGKPDYTIEELKAACEMLAGKTTDEERSRAPTAGDHPQSRALKAASLYALMMHFGINEIHFRLSVGSVPGLLISPEFWQE